MWLQHEDWQAWECHDLHLPSKLFCSKCGNGTVILYCVQDLWCVNHFEMELLLSCRKTKCLQQPFTSGCMETCLKTSFIRWLKPVSMMPGPPGKSSVITTTWRYVDTAEGHGSEDRASAFRHLGKWICIFKISVKRAVPDEYALPQTGSKSINSRRAAEVIQISTFWQPSL